jgi:hypothetical protein
MSPFERQLTTLHPELVMWQYKVCLVSRCSLTSASMAATAGSLTPPGPCVCRSTPVPAPTAIVQKTVSGRIQRTTTAGQPRQQP